MRNKFPVACLASALLCAAAMVGPELARAERAHHPQGPFHVVFKVSTSSDFFAGNAPATLMLTNGALTGKLDISELVGNPDICTVLPGSTDSRGNLKLSCREQILSDILTFAGKLHPLTGIGRGTFSEDVFGTTGTYRTRK